MNTSYERISNTTDEWYTPKHIVDALGVFDLDPCAPINRLWDTAKEHLTKEDNGLIHDWEGKRVWLNPPYSKPLFNQFIKKMVGNNGTLLTFSRFDTKLFQDVILPNATAMKLLRGRIKFYRPDGTQGDSAGCGSVLIAFGEEDARILESSVLEGKFIRLN